MNVVGNRAVNLNNFPLLDAVYRHVRKNNSGDITTQEMCVVMLRELQSYAMTAGMPWEDIECMAAAMHDETIPLTTGLVEKFFGDSNREYGFTKDGVFFHLNNGYEFACDGSDLPVRVDRRPAAPKTGSRIVYEATTTERGTKATWWAYPESYEAAVRQIEQRPEYRLWRIGTGRVAWIGKNLANLRIAYPPHVNLQLHLLQPQKLVDGVWVDCPDPR